MQITATIDLDWVDPETGIDEEVERKLLSALTKRLEDEFIKDAGKAVAQAAQKLITAKTELLINSVLEKPVTISNGWNDKQEYDSIYDMVEQKMTALYEGKLGNKNKCEKDPLLSNIESFVKSSVDKLLNDVEVIIKKSASAAASKEVREHELFKTLEKVVTIKSSSQ